MKCFNELLYPWSKDDRESVDLLNSSLGSLGREGDLLNSFQKLSCRILSFKIDVGKKLAKLNDTIS